MCQGWLLAPHRHGALVLAGVLRLGDADVQGGALAVHGDGGPLHVLGGHYHLPDGDLGGVTVHLAPDDLHSVCKGKMSTSTLYHCDYEPWLKH